MLIGLIISFVVARFITSDAYKRGMNGLGWGISTFFLMIIVLPVYFIVRKPIIEKKEKNQDEMENENFLKNLFYITLDGKQYKIPKYTSIKFESSIITDEILEKIVEDMKGFLEKKEGRVTSLRPLKRVIFENLLYREMETEQLIKFLLIDEENIKKYYDNMVVDKKLIQDYYSMLNNNTFKYVESGIYFSNKTQNLFDKYERKFTDVLYQYFFDEYFFDYCSDVFFRLNEKLKIKLDYEIANLFVQKLINIFNLEFSPIFDEFLLRYDISDNYDNFLVEENNN